MAFSNGNIMLFSKNMFTTDKYNDIILQELNFWNSKNIYVYKIKSTGKELNNNELEHWNIRKIWIG